MPSLPDSASDLTDALAKKLDLTVLPLKFIIEGVEYPDYLDHRAMSPEDFYAKVRKGFDAFNSSSNIQEYLDACEPVLKQGKDVLVIVFSSALSGTYNSARVALEQLKEKRILKENFIWLIPLAASLGEGTACCKSSRNEKTWGYSIEDVSEYLEAHKLNLAHWFTVSDIQHLKKRRISGAAAIVAGV